MTLAEVLKSWSRLYSLAGNASATLIGLLFVAALVSSGYTQDRNPGLRLFISPSVVHFSIVLVASLIALALLENQLFIAVLVGSDGLFGVIYASLVLHRMMQQGFLARIDWEDRVWYLALPTIGYAMMVAAAVSFLLEISIACGLLALAMVALLLAGIRNAWDITVWMITRRMD
jgi:hypothetical protein